MLPCVCKGDDDACNVTLSSLVTTAQCQAAVDVVADEQRKQYVHMSRACTLTFDFLVLTPQPVCRPDLASNHRRSAAAASTVPRQDIVARKRLHQKHFRAREKVIREARRSEVDCFDLSAVFRI